MATDVDMTSAAGPSTDLDFLLLRTSPLAGEGFEPGPEVRVGLQEAKVLVIGAGGLGCELLKNLALSGFKNIEVIDMDKIELTNLNRQFLFRPEDVGKPKSEVAAKFVMNRVKGVNVKAHYGKIQDFDDDYYKGFSLIIAGLDSIEARRWLNAELHQILSYNSDGSLDYSTIRPFIDGGTEGLKGQSRVILPGMTACFECALDMFPPQVNFPICTLAETPRLPEHCIEWAMVLQWPVVWKDVDLDGDNPEHIKWIYESALGRANEHNISGVTLMLTQGVVKRIIPAIASTNAVVAASCVNEALKVVTLIAPYLSNYMMYNGGEGTYTHTFEYERNESCAVCGNTPIPICVDGGLTLKELIVKLSELPALQLKAPSLRCGNESLYMQKPPMLEKMTRENLDKHLKDLFKSGDTLDVSDPALPGVTASVIVRFEGF